MWLQLHDGATVEWQLSWSCARKKKRIDERVAGIRDKSFELAGADGVYNLQQNKHTISKTTMSPREIQNGIICIVKMTFGMDSKQGFTPLWYIRGDHWCLVLLSPRTRKSCLFLSLKCKKAPMAFSDCTCLTAGRNQLWKRRITLIDQW